MKFDYYEHSIASHYLSALINCDESGLSDGESIDFHAWVESTDPKIEHWDCIDYGDNFKRDEVSGLFADCATVRGYFRI